MSDDYAGIPTWLVNAHNAEHLTDVIRTLGKREGLRSAARAASLYQASSQKRHTIAQIASAMNTKAARTDHYSISAGADTANARSNRYVDILPYDRTRVVVCPGAVGHACSSDCADGRYLNANWVRERTGGKWWVATQAPLPHTAHAFLSVFLDGVSPPPSSSPSSSSPSPSASTSTGADPTHTLRARARIRTVVQLTPNIEHGKRKAHVYFPPLPGQSWVVEPDPAPGMPGASAPPAANRPISVTLLRAHDVPAAHAAHSAVAVQALDPASRAPVGPRVVFQHLLYASWPDHGVPAREDREGLLAFARLVHDVNRDLAAHAELEGGQGDGGGGDELDPDPPMMVNCSAGVGRTGAFIALCSLLRHCGLLPPVEGGPPGELPPSPLGALQSDLVAQEIDALREQRPGMVQRDDQILMVYETLISALVDVKGKEGAK
ncbi:phosphatases II [Epithele typhae]|uniref:phosphatases II n=1 Tax=Epithele typhae TaxID=378194 RepID=UPI0020079A62|nr:phosphatases II [Epithele typhae]KAH9932065.1 phosphatases II [Epithele typhae]